MLIKCIKPHNLLSFGPNFQPLEMGPLNVLIGPNGSGKSNLIEAIGLLQATPRDLTEPIREGGGISDWIWRGEPSAKEASIEVLVERIQLAVRNCATGSVLQRVASASN